MYHLIRKIHLYCGLVILLFLMMYFVSGYIMTHRAWFASKSPAPVVALADHQPTPSMTAEDVAVDVKRTLNLSGRIQFPLKQPSDETLFWAIRPGTMIRVDVPRTNHQVRTTTQRVGIVGTLIMLHKVAGYDDQPLFDASAFFSDLAGLSMILFAFSGVYLWWKRVKNHTLGIICLFASCAYAIGMMLHFAYSP